MGREFRKLDREDLDAALGLELESYPANGYSEEDKQRIRGWIGEAMDDPDGARAYYGILEDGQILAQMCLLTFELNCRGQMILAGGIGSVATALLHRQHGAARDLLQAGLGHFRAMDVSLVTLYPFRLGFYRKMGFGYGAEVRRYRVAPAHFPSRRVSGVLRRYTGSASERRALLDCYTTSLYQTHGMISRLNRSMADAFRGELAPVVYEREGKVEGYLVVDFERHYVMKNDLVVREWVYNTPEALHALSGFLHRQGDQFEKIILETQDPNLAMILNDVSSDTYDAFHSQFVETHSSGIGMLYRVVNLPKLLETMNSLVLQGPEVVVKVSCADDFLPDNQAPVYLSLAGGRIRVIPETAVDVEVTTDVATFSSLWMGAIDLTSSIRLGLAEVTPDSARPALEGLFQVGAKPQCWQHF